MEQNLKVIAQEIREIAKRLPDLPRLAELLEQVDDVDKIVADSKKSIEMWKGTEKDARDHASNFIGYADEARKKLEAVEKELAEKQKKLTEIRSRLAELSKL
jgi:uncharacterized coiled-coil DUF342 family protein